MANAVIPGPPRTIATQVSLKHTTFAPFVRHVGPFDPEQSRRKRIVRAPFVIPETGWTRGL